MLWLALTLAVVGVLVLVTARRRAAQRKQRIDPASYQALADLYAIRRRLDVALFKQRLSREMAEARRRLSAELDEDGGER